MTNLKHAVPRGKRIVEDRIVGKVPHGKVIDLADGAGVARARSVNPLDRDAARKHGFTLNEAHRVRSRYAIAESLRGSRGAG